jgi:protein subunit release factor B
MLKLVELLAPDWINKAEKLGFKEEDLQEQFVRGSGKGGQKINKTSNCVLLKHLPSGLEVRVQKHRELLKNRRSALKLLLEKLEYKMLGKDSGVSKKIEKLCKQKKRRQKRALQKQQNEDQSSALI